MEGPIKGDKGEGAPAAGALPTRREAVPRSGGGRAEGGAKESYPANTTPGGTGGEAEGPPSPVVLLPWAASSEQGGKGEGAPGVKGAEEDPPVAAKPREVRKEIQGRLSSVRITQCCYAEEDDSLVSE